jgi:hypothetical protein
VLLYTQHTPNNHGRKPTRITSCVTNKFSIFISVLRWVLRPPKKLFSVCLFVSILFPPPPVCTYNVCRHAHLLSIPSAKVCLCVYSFFFFPDLRLCVLHALLLLWCFTFANSYSIGTTGPMSMTSALTPPDGTRVVLSAFKKVVSLLFYSLEKKKKRESCIVLYSYVCLSHFFFFFWSGLIHLRSVEGANNTSCAITTELYIYWFRTSQ